MVIPSRLRCGFAVGAVLAAITLGFLVVSRAQALELVRHYGYWATAAGVAAAGWAAADWIRAEGSTARHWLRGLRWPVVALWGVAVASSLATQPPGYRLVVDEPMLVGTSAEMHFSREVGYAKRGYDLGQGFVALQSAVDRRPLLYPFAVSLLHDLTGYRIENAIYLNGAAFAAAAALMLIIGRRLGGEWGGAFAMLALLSVPLLAHQALGAGFDVVHLTLVLAATWLACLYCDQPSDVRLNALVLTGVMLTQVRYESALFLAMIVVVIGLVAWRERRLRLPGLAIAAPLLLVHHTWLLRMFEAESTWQLFGREGATRPFGWEFFRDNVGHALNFFLTFDGARPNSPWLFIVGALAVPGLALLARRHLRTWWTNEPAWIGFLVLMAGIALHLGLMLSYFWGQFDDVTAQRLSLPSHVLLALATTAVLALQPRSQTWLRAATIVALIGLVTFTLPSLRHNAYGRANSAACRARWVDAFAATQKDRAVLALDNLSELVWLARRLPAVTIESVRAEPARLTRHFALSSFADVFVSQALARDPESGAWAIVLEDDLGPGCTLETIAELRLSPVKMQRLSRLTAIDAARPPPPNPSRPPGRPIGNVDRGKPFLESWASTLP